MSYDGELLKAIQSLEDFHGKALTPEARVYYADALSNLPTALVVSGLKRWKTQTSPSTRLPSLAQLRQSIDDVRTAEWQKGKAGENRNPISAPKLALEPAYQAACWNLVKRAWTLSPGGLADAFDDMHKAWPNRRSLEFDGWDRAADRLRAKIAKGHGVTRHKPATPAAVTRTPMTRAQEEERRMELLNQAASLVGVGKDSDVTHPTNALQPKGAAE